MCISVFSFVPFSGLICILVFVPISGLICMKVKVKFTWRSNSDFFYPTMKKESMKNQPILKLRVSQTTPLSTLICMKVKVTWRSISFLRAKSHHGKELIKHQPLLRFFHEIILKIWIERSAFCVNTGIWQSFKTTPKDLLELLLVVHTLLFLNFLRKPK